MAIRSFMAFGSGMGWRLEKLHVQFRSCCPQSQVPQKEQAEAVMDCRGLQVLDIVDEAQYPLERPIITVTACGFGFRGGA